jgi:hypothetical protein
MKAYMIEKMIELSEKLIEKGRFSRDEIIGYDEQEINNLENDICFSLPKAYRDLLAFCGKECPQQLSEFMLMSDLIPTYLLDIYQMADFSNYPFEVKPDSEINSLIFPVLYKNLCFFSFNVSCFLFFFLDENQDPDVFMYSDGQEVVDTDMKLSEYFYQQAIRLEESRSEEFRAAVFAEFQERRRQRRALLSDST